MSTQTLYERVATHLGEQIRRGVLRAGERMPSLRQLGRDQGVSVSTAVEVYAQLERQGLLDARPRSGYYIRAMPAPGAAGTRAPARLARTPQPVRQPELLCVPEELTRKARMALHSATPAPALLPGAALHSALQRVMRRDPDAAFATWARFLAEEPHDAAARAELERLAESGPRWRELASLCPMISLWSATTTLPWR